MPNEITFDTIIRDVKAHKFKPVYILMGEEPYYIELIQKAIVENALPPEDRDFCFSMFFGDETTANEVINAARSFPMGDRQVVLVKNAKDISDIDELAVYLANPQPTTILVLVNQGGTFDRRKKFMTIAAKIGVVYATPKVEEKSLPSLITSFFRNKGYTIDPKSVALIAESIGTDLMKLYSEMNKLADALVGEQRNITPELVEQFIGISKDFNVYELANALTAKNSFKAFQIAKYFDENPKQYPLPKILPALFRTFSQLMVAHYAPAKDPKTIAEYLGLSPWLVEKAIMPALRIFSASKVLSVLWAIRDADERCKGIGNSKTPDGELLKELIFFILH